MLEFHFLAKICRFLPFSIENSKLKINLLSDTNFVQPQSLSIYVWGFHAQFQDCRTNDKKKNATFSIYLTNTGK